MSSPDIAELARRYGVPVASSGGQAVLFPSRENYVALVASLKCDGYVMCVDVCAVDYLNYTAARGLPEGIQSERFEVVANLANHAERCRVRTRVQVPGQDPTCPSLWSIHAGVENPEREAFDLFGITFTDHPDMTRILMPEAWEGHPLRKDYPVGRIPVQFKAAPT